MREYVNLTLFAVLLLPAIADDTLDSKKYPVSKVITLLKDMVDQLEKEAEEDEEVYEKMACWCKTNDREKTKAVSDAQAHIADLTTSIEASTARSAQLTQEIAGHEQDLAKSKSALDQATNLRKKQLSEFTDEEKDLLQSIKALDSAIVVLSKHHTGAVLLNDAELDSITQLVKSHSALLQGRITPHQRHAVLGFLQQEPDFSGAQTNSRLQQTYNPASGEIFGILKQMKETFETNLASSQKEALSDQKKYEDLKSAKQDEIKAITNAIEEKKGQLAETDEKNAQAKEDLEDTQNSLTADEAFLIDLKKRCSMTDSEWETRQRMRQEEIQAVTEAISILSDDAAHDTFSRTLSFVQTRSVVKSSRRTAAVKVLSKAMSRTSDAQLAELVVVAQLDAFEKVKAAIDKMVTELAEAKKEEIMHRDSCIDQLNENQRFTEKSERNKVDIQASLDGSRSTIQELTDAVQALQGEITEMTVQMKRAGEDREKENKDFQLTVADQREAQKLLNKALAVLKGVYAQKGGGFVQLHRVFMHAAQEPPAGFKAYRKAGGAGGVIGLMQQIISDAKLMEVEAIKDEQASQEKYESFVKQTNIAIEEKRQSIINKNEDKADAEKKMEASKVDLQSENDELATLEGGATALHKSCDFLLKNFELRQEGFDEEIEALRQAKAILSGMDTED